MRPANCVSSRARGSCPVSSRPRAQARPFSAIADAAVTTALEAVSQKFFAEHGAVPGGRLVVIGFGRLGSRQLTAESDLDLVVLYDFDPEDRTSAGPKRIDAAVAYNRLTQRLVAALTAPTRRGLLYEVDLRLRPGGGQGATATQFRSFRSYQSEEAELWEHMALTRARVIAGDASLAEEVSGVIEEALRRPREAKAVYAAVRDMRATVEREKGDHGPLDLKLAPGGLLDLDFLGQALVLGMPTSIPISSASTRRPCSPAREKPASSTAARRSGWRKPTASSTTCISGSA